jgi:hypothetical protein
MVHRVEAPDHQIGRNPQPAPLVVMRDLAGHERQPPLEVVQELIGHATIQMTMRHAHLCPEVAREHVMLLDAPSVPRGSGVAAEPENATR